MKTLILPLLLFPFLVFGQGNFTKTFSATANYTVGGSLATLTNSAAATNLFTQTIPGGLLGTAKHVHVTLVCQLSSTIINPALTLTLKYGTSTLVVANTAGINASLSSVPFILNADIYAVNSTSSQVATATISNSTSGALGLNMYQAVGTWAIDSTVDQTLAITAQFNSALTGTTLIPLLMTIETR